MSNSGKVSSDGLFLSVELYKMGSDGIGRLVNKIFQEQSPPSARLKHPSKDRAGIETQFSGQLGNDSGVTFNGIASRFPSCQSAQEFRYVLIASFLEQGSSSSRFFIAGAVDVDIPD
jgi:hypothetical protein